jgi:hypothetical protein
VPELLTALAEQFPDADVGADVDAFLDALRREELLEQV